MNIDLIKDALYNPHDRKNVLLVKELSIRLKDKNFVNRLNEALNYANSYPLTNEVELMFMRK